MEVLGRLWFVLKCFAQHWWVLLPWTVAMQLVVFAAFVAGKVEEVLSSETGVCEVVIKGRFADWMRRPNADGWSWRGFTLGAVVLYWGQPDEEIRRHERMHVRQNFVWGPLYPLVYLVLLAIYGYKRHPMERDL